MLPIKADKSTIHKRLYPFQTFLPTQIPHLNTPFPFPQRPHTQCLINLSKYIASEERSISHLVDYSLCMTCDDVSDLFVEVSSCWEG